VVGVPKGDIGHQSIEVGPTDCAVGKIEEATEEAAGDRLVETLDATRVEQNACCSEPFLDQTGVIAGGRVDEHDAVQWGAGPRGLDDPSDRVAHRLVLLWSGRHDAGHPRSGGLGFRDLDTEGRG